MDLEMIKGFVDLIVNNGVSLGCLLYFMYMNNTTMKELKETISELKELIKELIIKEESK